MFGLITDREQSNVNRRNLLAQKSWQDMTAAEQAEWSGDPTKAALIAYTKPVNLLPNDPYYSESVELTYRSSSITATSLNGGTYQYAVAIIGNAADYEGKTFTLSLASTYVSGSATPQVAMYWHDDNGYEYAGASLTAAGSTTFTIADNTGSRAYLAMYIYVTTDATVEAGETVRYIGLMFEEGSVRHSYVPYTPILPTDATKGAYNYSDVNRVEGAVAEIAEKYGLSLETKTDWGVWDEPKEADLSRYISNVVAIRNACPSKSILPAVPSRMNKLTYETANTIEEILDVANKSADSVNRCGELLCGEV